MSILALISAISQCRVLDSRYHKVYFRSVKCSGIRYRFRPMGQKETIMRRILLEVLAIMALTALIGAAMVVGSLALAWLVSIVTRG